VHAALAGGGEVGAAVLLPGDLRRRVALGGALQPRRVARADGAVPRGLQEGRQDCSGGRGGVSSLLAIAIISLASPLPLLPFLTVPTHGALNALRAPAGCGSPTGQRAQ